jgi:hypothetical protein
MHLSPYGATASPDLALAGVGAGVRFRPKADLQVLEDRQRPFPEFPYGPQIKGRGIHIPLPFFKYAVYGNQFHEPHYICIILGQLETTAGEDTVGHVGLVVTDARTWGSFSVGQHVLTGRTPDQGIGLASNVLLNYRG